jgi:phosphoserine phosphatase
MDRVFANEILFKDGVATGEARSCVPEGGKGRIVAQLQAEFGVARDECMAVGDSTSDADMFRQVQVGAAVNPSSEQVRAAAGLVLEAPDLWPLLPRVQEMMPGWIPGVDQGSSQATASGERTPITSSVTPPQG